MSQEEPNSKKSLTIPCGLLDISGATSGLLVFHKCQKAETLSWGKEKEASTSSKE